MTFQQNTSQQDNQTAFDANEVREKECIQWLNSKKKQFKSLINITAFIGILNGVFIILQSALLAYLFQQFIIEHVFWHQLISFFALLVVIFVLRNVSAYFYQVQGFKVATTVKRSVRSELLNKLSSLDPTYIKAHTSGELATTTLEKTEALEGYFSRFLPQQIVASFLPLIIIAVVFPVNWVVAVIFLVTGPLIPLFMMLVGMGAESAHRNQFLALSRMSGYFFDRLQGLTTLKLFGQAEAELNRVKEVANDFREKTMSVLRIAFLSSAVLEFFSAIAVALVAVYVGLGLLGLIRFGPAIDITLQEALFVLLLAPEFFNPLKQLAAHYHDKAAAIGATDQILGVLEQVSETDLNQHINNSNYCIELQEVTKHYQKKEVLKDLNLQIKDGEKIALTGESGIGKTTVFNLLLGFESVTKGTVFIKGEKAHQRNAEKFIAWSGQQPTIFYGSIKENISLHNPEISPLQIKTAADAAGVSEYSQHLEKGLDTVVGEKGFGLSGGQIQRIALARAFVKEAPIILLDEPTAHLDTENKIRLLDVIDHLFKDKTLIIASHDPMVIARMDRTIHLS